MKYIQLGTSDLQVSRLCLGTMTWGEQNDQKDANEQLDYSVSKGINFIDAAEMYSVPTSERTFGHTEEILGNWLVERNGRDKVIVATKMSGPGISYIRGGAGLNPADVSTAIDGSLKRLKTDYIDLYQLHWPQRRTNTFCQRDFQAHLHGQDMGEYIHGMLVALGEQVKAGKIRHIGLSNEGPWGLMKHMEFHKLDSSLPRIQSNQNPYSLIQREYDNHTSEVSMRESIGLLAYSPLGGGALTGKYLQGKQPEGARMSTWGVDIQSMLYQNRDSQIVRDYCALADDLGITPTQLALAFVNSRPFLGSNIFGATTMDQLKECISAEEITLDDDALERIEVLHDACPNPALRRGGNRDQR